MYTHVHVLYPSYCTLTHVPTLISYTVFSLHAYTQLFTLHDVEKAITAITVILMDTHKPWETRITAVSYSQCTTHVHS